MDTNQTQRPLELRDCAQVAIATGRSAKNLRELREQLVVASPASIYHHFWGRLLLPQFAEPEYNNDFASWAFVAMHDKTLAEQLSAINPSQYNSTEELRTDLVDIVEARMDESELLAWRQADHDFYFMRAQMVVFNTDTRIETPFDLRAALEHVSEGTIFYHFIDARRRTETRQDDFTLWLQGFGDDFAELTQAVDAIDPYFSALLGIRNRLINTFDQHLQGGIYGSAGAV
jgi:hypothetical protein